MLVVSLTTIPPRFHLLDATLRSILDQNVKIDAVEVWIPESYRRFPQHTFCKPDVPEGVTVRISNEDFGPATKILPAAQAYRGTDARILYCDDDHTMHKGWAQSFLTVSEQNPDCAITISGCDIEFFGAKARMNKLRPRAIKKNRLLDMPFQWRKLQKKRRQRELGHKLPKIQPDAFFWREGYVDIMEGFCGVLVRPICSIKRLSKYQISCGQWMIFGSRVCLPRKTSVSGLIERRRYQRSSQMLRTLYVPQ